MANIENMDIEYEYFDLENTKYCILNDIETSIVSSGQFKLSGKYNEKRGAVLDFEICKDCGNYNYISKNNVLYQDKIYCKCICPAKCGGVFTCKRCFSKDQKYKYDKEKEIEELKQKLNNYERMFKHTEKYDFDTSLSDCIDMLNNFHI